MNSRILTIDEEHDLRRRWRRFDTDTRISWRDFWLTAQRDLTRAETLKEVGEWINNVLKIDDLFALRPNTIELVNGIKSLLAGKFPEALKCGELPPVG